MHILTGLLLAGLLRHRKNEDVRKVQTPAQDSRLPYAPSVLSILHSIPGRIRFRVPVLKNRPETASKLSETLSKIEPVRQTLVDSRSGSVLIAYEADALTPDVLGGAIIRLLGIESAITGPVQSRMRREAKLLSRSFNRSVYESTGGWLDLHTLLMMALAAFGLRQVLQKRAASFPAGMTLLWWGMNGLLGDHTEGS